MNISILSNFGFPIQGVSPYSELLTDALDACDTKSRIRKVNYDAAYPNFLSPSTFAATLAHETKGAIHYARPSTWRSFCASADEVVHIQYWTQFSAYYLTYICNELGRIGKKSIVTVHNTSPHERLPFFGLFEDRLLNEASHLIVHTGSCAENLSDRLMKSKDKISVIPHGIRISNEVVDEPADKYVLMFGNLRAYKGTDLLIDAWEKIYSQFPEVRLLLAGRLWGHQASLPRRVVNSILSNTQFSKNVAKRLTKADDINIEARLGFIEDNILDQLIANATLAVFPYRKFSAQSGAAALAAGAGVPIITSDLPGLTSLTLDSSYVVPPSDVDELAQAISSKLRLIDANTRIQQRDLASQYSWDRVAKMHLDVYEKVAAL